MRTKRNNRGFTMAELLIVVAIIGILAGVSFIAVQRYQRSTAQLERDTVAKEIFIAAQNHLAMAESQGYLGTTIFGNGDSGNVYYLVKGDGNSAAMLDLMLPFGSIDETVRGSGSYLIRYQINPAAVLDVFYCSTFGTPEEYNHTIAASESEYQTFLGYQNNPPGSGYIVGWYGGDKVPASGGYWETPTVVVNNAEKLVVKVTDPNIGKSDASIKLMVEGFTSGAQAAFVLDSASKRDTRVSGPEDGVYTITLDDVTKADVINDAGWHFCSLNDPRYTLPECVAVSGTFQPGEDITVWAVAYSNTALSNIAYSNEIRTNSLFADIVNTGSAEGTTGSSAAMIANLRHLENLDAGVSGFDSTIGLTSVSQIADLSWDEFKTKIDEESVRIYKIGDSDGTAEDCYYPVTLPANITYEGNSHTVSSLRVDGSENGGLFASASNCYIQNMALVDFSIKSSANAGALAGSLTGCVVSNVAAYNTPAFEETLAGDKTTVSASGSAGGLIGAMSGTTVSKCAAALIVNGATAGGLIGEAEDESSVNACYSGGHTDNAMYSNSAYNVTASGVAGGLIGAAGDTEIENSYSTCSAKGATAGGFVGTSKGEIENCYATGLVSGSDKEGAFAGTLERAPSGCYYYQIINERSDSENGGYTSLAPVSGDGEYDQDEITALDANAAAYESFIGSERKDARVYDNTLKNYYDTDLEEGTTSYALKTVAQLQPTETSENAKVADVDFVATHYGDWPAPETFVVNTK